MKLYARQALSQYGVANYVLSEERFIEDDSTGEIFVVSEDVQETEEQLVERLRQGTFSLSGKSYPRERPCAPDPSPLPIITNNAPSYQKLSQKSINEICQRLQKRTFAKKLMESSEPAGPSSQICSSVKWRLNPENKGKQRPQSYYTYKHPDYSSLSDNKEDRRSQSVQEEYKSVTPKPGPIESQIQADQINVASKNNKSISAKSGIYENNYSKSNNPSPQVSRSNVNTPRSNIYNLKSNVDAQRSNIVTPRSNVVTPRSNVVTPRSKVVTPRSKENSPRSRLTTPRKQESTSQPNNRTTTPRSGMISPTSNRQQSKSLKSATSISSSKHAPNYGQHSFEKSASVYRSNSMKSANSVVSGLIAAKNKSESERVSGSTKSREVSEIRLGDAMEDNRHTSPSNQYSSRKSNDVYSAKTKNFEHSSGKLQEVEKYEQQRKTSAKYSQHTKSSTSIRELITY